MRFSTLICLILTSLVAYLGSCGLIPSLSCDLKITDEYIESTCGLVNGVRFEELIVDTFYSDGKPKIYKVVCSYSANPYANNPTKFRNIDRLYFDNREGICDWGKDSATNGVYKNFGVSRELVDDIYNLSQDSIVEIRSYVTNDSMVVTGGKPPRNLELYSRRVEIKCPLTFKPNTWYYVNFRDQRYEAYLYVDSHLNYNLSKISKPTNF